MGVKTRKAQMNNSVPKHPAHLFERKKKGKEKKAGNKGESLTT